MARSAIFARAAEQWAEMRDSFENHVQYEYLRAVEDTAGVLTNKLGRALKIDGMDLFTGPAGKALKYASEELIDYWKRHPRLSMSEFERQWLEGNHEDHSHFQQDRQDSRTSAA